MPHCPICGRSISRQTPQQIVDQLMRAGGGHALPGARAGRPQKKGEFVDLFAELQPRASPGPASTARCIQLTEPPKLKKQDKHDHRGRRRPARRRGQSPSSGSPTRSRPRCGSPTAWSSSTSSTCARTTRTASGASPSSWPAPTATRSRSTSSSRAPSRSTRPSAPARSAPASAPRRRSTPSWSCPTPTVASREGAIPPWAGGHDARVLRPAAGRRSPTPSGFRMDTPWERLPRDVRRRRCCTAATTRSTSATATATAASARTTPTSRASSRSSSAGTADRVRRAARAVRGLHARRALPGLQGHAAQARGPGRHPPAPRPGRALDRRGLWPCRWPSARSSSRDGARRPAGDDRRAPSL